MTCIILDHREQLENLEVEKGEVTLLYPPAMIIFKPLHSMFPIFNSFEEGEIPLFSSKHAFRIMTSLGQKCSVSRHQYNLTLGYAFTHNKSQGQTPSGKSKKFLAGLFSLSALKSLFKADKENQARDLLKFDLRFK